jgi:hypothetical protein
MKIAIILFGISYTEEYKHWSNINYKIDYRKSLDNYKRYIFDYYKKNGYTCDVYISTYDSAMNEELLEHYKPVQYYINNKFDVNRICSRNDLFVKGINLYLEHAIQNKINYDLVLITRFDLEFKISFDDVKINNNTINIVSELETPDAIDDNLYILPHKYVLYLKNITKINRLYESHYIKKNLVYILKTQKINYLKNENCMVNDLTFYKIIRCISC